jgi:hypothetical protein
MTAPSIGRTVHTVDGAGECRAAIVTEVAPAVGQDAVLPRVGLTVFHPMEVLSKPLSEGGSVYDDSAEPESWTWHWPERV